MRRMKRITLLGLFCTWGACHAQHAADIVDADGADVAAPDTTDAPPVDDDAPFAAQRAGCAFAAGTPAKDTFGPSLASQPIPLDVFVIMVHENRSFDHYLSQLPAFGQPDVAVAADNASIPGPNNTTVTRFHQTSLCAADAGHSWNAMHHDWNNGLNDGFAITNVTAADPTGKHSVGYYDATDLPFYYAAANTFAINDHYFSPTLTSTGPNRLYLYAATSNGSITNNGSAGIPVAKTIFGLMQNSAVTWKVYSTSTYSFEGSIFSSLPTSYPQKFGSMTDFAADAAAGTLPNVVFLYPGSDEHPPADVQSGQHDSATLYAKLAASPQWGRLAVFYTYDEAGGFYDHMPPPKACAPDTVPPALAAGDRPGDFAQYGFRVPLIVASAWAKPHYVSHVVNDHTSILRLLELRFSLPALTARDANANGLLDLFDFTHASFPTAPPLPAAPVELARKC
ncbi:MAG: Acid phosphatase [Myxococcales bacterium]|nr:Acid phosphatase [Myxococcales bacterium]